MRETKLSECAYVVSSDTADFGARYYLAAREIPLAGHPTVATVISLINRGAVVLDQGRAAFTLEVGAGILDIEVRDDGTGPIVTMTQRPPWFGPYCDGAEIAAIYGLSPGDILGSPRIVSTGTPFCITVLASRDALRRARLDLDALAAWQAKFPDLNAGIMEPFLVTLGGATGAGDTFSRLLLPPPNPPEDPFTGSATGCMGAYLWSERMIDTPIFAAEQGHDMGRPGLARVECIGPPEAIAHVKVGGRGYVLMQGDLTLS